MADLDVKAMVEQIARAVSLSYGENPDDFAPLGKICGPNNEPVPEWQAYVEQAKAVLEWLSPVLLSAHEAGFAAGAEWRPISEAPHDVEVLLGWQDWRDGSWRSEFGPASHGQRYDNGYSSMSAHGSATHFMPPPRTTQGDRNMIAALYVDARGSYIGLPGVDPWDEARDARLYDGPYPVVAHPPCQRWGKLWAGQPLWIKRTGERKKKGDDGGCFAAALAAVRKHGGVIEHPWQSHAWPHFGLAVPPRTGGWVKADDQGGWTCCVEQGRYGHYARKPTLLYVVGTDLPELDWGKSEARLDPAVVARLGLKRAKRLGEVGARGGGKDSKPRIGTPAAFRDLLINLARSVPAEFRSAA